MKLILLSSYVTPWMQNDMMSLLQTGFGEQKKDTGLVIAVPDRGRRIRMGSLYDVNKDQNVPGMMWSSQLDHHVVKLPAYNANYQFGIIETFKSMRLNFSFQMKFDLSISLLFFSINVNIEAGLSLSLEEKTKETTINLNIKTKSYRNVLDLWAIPNRYMQIPPPSVMNSGASHVVVGVEYGGDVTAKFKAKEYSKDFSLKGTGILNGISESKNIKTNTVNCSVLGDLPPQGPYPQTLEAAMPFIANLASKIGEGVPKTLFLYPISSIIDSAPKIPSFDVSQAVYKIVMNIFDELSDVVDKCQDTLRTDPGGAVKIWKNDVLKFCSDLREFIGVLEHNRKNQSEKIKKGQMDETELMELVSNYTSSKFKKEKSFKYLDIKKNEIGTLSAVIEGIEKSGGVVASSYSDYSSATLDDGEVYSLLFVGLDGEAQRNTGLPLARQLSEYATLKKGKAIFLHVDSFLENFQDAEVPVPEETSVFKFENSQLISRKATFSVKPMAPSKVHIHWGGGNPAVFCVNTTALSNDKPVSLIGISLNNSTSSNSTESESTDAEGKPGPNPSLCYARLSWTPGSHQNNISNKDQYSLNTTYNDNTIIDINLSQDEDIHGSTAGLSGWTLEKEHLSVSRNKDGVYDIKISQKNETRMSLGHTGIRIKHLDPHKWFRFRVAGISNSLDGVFGGFSRWIKTQTTLSAHTIHIDGEYGKNNTEPIIITINKIQNITWRKVFKAYIGGALCKDISIVEDKYNIQKIKCIPPNPQRIYTPRPTVFETASLTEESPPKMIDVSIELRDINDTVIALGETRYNVSNPTGFGIELDPFKMSEALFNKKKEDLEKKKKDEEKKKLMKKESKKNDTSTEDISLIEKNSKYIDFDGILLENITGYNEITGKFKKKKPSPGSLYKPYTHNITISEISLKHPNEGFEPLRIPIEEATSHNHQGLKPPPVSDSTRLPSPRQPFLLQISV
eukprot:GHVL01044006.1.p1 GENE.GHVL01044006.1~~GHVL01044006.1.p1  ORF type:complete len:1078 (-),score=268.87 GHVL01044006.1:2737-5622(-)